MSGQKLLATVLLAFTVVHAAAGTAPVIPTAIDSNLGSTGGGIMPGTPLVPPALTAKLSQGGSALTEAGDATGAKTLARGRRSARAASPFVPRKRSKSRQSRSNSRSKSGRSPRNSRAGRGARQHRSARSKGRGGSRRGSTTRRRAARSLAPRSFDEVLEVRNRGFRRGRAPSSRHIGPIPKIGPAGRARLGRIAGNGVRLAAQKMTQHLMPTASRIANRVGRRFGIRDLQDLGVEARYFVEGEEIDLREFLEFAEALEQRSLELEGLNGLE